tara:strand:+ start:1808 stop:2836 length:1029 start_codon:yes stop_codon:yes gene_type:complete
MKTTNPQGSPNFVDRAEEMLDDLGEQILRGLAKGGLMHSETGGDCKAIKKLAPSETCLSNAWGCDITMGGDMPASRGSGYGSRGMTGQQEGGIGCGRIDIVVGRMASARSGEGVKPGTYVDNSFFADAARVYISETSDVDQNFGLSEGIVGNPRAQSCVAMKADQCRMIGRSGIKIMTGAGLNVDGYGFRGETTSKGGKLSVAPGIDLIAGNQAGDRVVWNPWNIPETVLDIQPVTKAYNVRDYLMELSELIGDIYSFILNLSLCMKTLAACQTAGMGWATSPFTSPLCALAAIGGAIVQGFLPWLVDNSVHQSRAQKNAIDFDYLQHPGYKFIGSRGVRVS